MTFGVVSAAILAISALSCYLPARRAVDVDPLITLKGNERRRLITIMKARRILRLSCARAVALRRASCDVFA